jgi:tetratricopeptide (TPR) repeat protein
MNLRFLIIGLICLGCHATYGQSNDIANRIRLAETYEQIGDFKKSKEVFSELLKTQPGNIEIFDGFYRVSIQLKEYQPLISGIEQMLVKTPSDINLYGKLGTVYYMLGEEKKAFECWDQAITAAKEDETAYRAIAAVALENRAFDKAVSKQPVFISYELATLLAQLQKYEQSADEYCSILLSDIRQLQQIESRMLPYITKPEALKVTLEVAKKWNDKTSGNCFNYFIAWLEMTGNNYDKAFEIYSDLDRTNNSGGSEVFNFAQIALREAQIQAAAKAFKFVIDNYPGSAFIPDSKTGFAKTEETALDKRYETLAESWKPYSTLEKLLSDAEVKKSYGRIAEIYKEISLSNKKSEASVEALYRAGCILLTKLNEPAEAEKLFSDAAARIPLSQFAVLSNKQLCDIKITAGELNKAAGFCDNIIQAPRASAQDRNAAICQKARIAFWKNDMDGALKLLEDVQNNLSDNSANDAIELSLLINSSKNDSAALVQYAAADLMAERSNFDSAAVIFKMTGYNESLFYLKDISKFRYAQMLIAKDNFPEASTVLSEIFANEKNVYADKALLLLGDLNFYGLNNIQNAKECYEKLLAKFPDSLYLDEVREKIISITQNRVR